MPIDFQPMQAANTPSGAPGTQQESAIGSAVEGAGDIARGIKQAPPIDFQPIGNAAPDNRTGLQKAGAAADYVTAGVSAAEGGALHALGKTAELPLTLASAAHDAILKGLQSQGYMANSDAKTSWLNTAKNAVENVGQKALDFQQSGASAQQAAHPTTAYLGNLAGEVAGSTLAAGGIVGDLGKGMNMVSRGILNQGAQGAIVGASADNESPIAGAVKGAVVGGIGGGLLGWAGRQSNIIADKIEAGASRGASPESEEVQQAIKQALANKGKDISTETIEKETKLALQKTIDAAAPEMNLSKAPMDTLTDMAKTNFKDVVEQRKALYAPLNESTAIAQTPNLTQALAGNFSKTTQKLLPDALPANPTLSDMMSYRRALSSGINSAETQVKMGTNIDAFKALKELNGLKTAATADLNTTAGTVGLGDQLAKADSFHLNNYKPFEVYDTSSGKLASEADTNETMTKISRLLMPRRPDYEAMANVAKTLGPQGKQLFGSAYLQQAMNRSMTVDGRINPTKVTAEFNKMANSGLADHILTPQLSDAFAGMRKIAEDAMKTRIGGSGGIMGSVMSKIPGLTNTSTGIHILRIIGSTPEKGLPKVLSQVRDGLLQSGLTGTEQAAAAP